jgi:hypothetical protein
VQEVPVVLDALAAYRKNVAAQLALPRQDQPVRHERAVAHPAVRVVVAAELRDVRVVRRDDRPAVVDLRAHDQLRPVEQVAHALGQGDVSSGSLRHQRRQYASVRAISARALLPDPSLSALTPVVRVPQAIQSETTSASPFAGTARLNPTVASTEPWLIALRPSSPSSASRQVPSAPPIALVPDRPVVDAALALVASR